MAENVPQGDSAMFAEDDLDLETSVVSDEVPGVGSAGRFDTGFDDNEDNETAIENPSTPETPESHTHTHLDLLS